MGGGAAGAGLAGRLLGREAKGLSLGPEDIELDVRKVVSLTLNGKKIALEVEARETLLSVLRDRLRLTGAKRVCNRGECGGCTVLLDGQPVYACLLLAVQADGREVVTVEGLASGAKLHPVQQAFIDKDAYQCGYCTPGFVLTAAALLQKNPSPSPDEVKAGMAGNICRCGNYQKIYAAVAAAGEAMRRG
ncbi:MAG: (2Fe-2S)-binding protein [Candidatus Aminicenantes bacterium]|nr:(2Fe-2S)-binding protein [Candidatus Aminicenantes bacterium]